MELLADITELPDGLCKYLAGVFAVDHKPLCVGIDDGFAVRSVIGDPAAYGLSIQPGQDLREQAPFLYGQSPDTASELKMIHLNGDLAVNVHIIPDHQQIDSEATAVIVLLDAGAEMRRTREHQQNANELTVMNYRQQQLMEQLDEAKKQAEQASELKSHFIASMSHEFRTPISSILGYTSLIDADTGGAESKFIGAIQRSANHLLGLVENLLEHGRAESDKIEIIRQPVALAELFADLTAMQTPQAKQKQLQFDIHGVGGDSDWVELDPVRVKQILVNLVTNAIRYTQQGYVRVNWGFHDGRLKVDVTDSGPGIAPEKQEEIFQAFSQVKAEGSQAGLGLGLAISQHLAELMDGSISLQSEPDQGSTFTVELAAAACAAPAPRGTGEVIVGRERRLLVVEDDLELGELLAIVLEDCGYQIKLCPTGSSAMEVLERFKPDAVLTDMNLPDATGPEVISELLSHKPELPVLAMSAANTEQSRSAAREAGALSYILKPFDFSELDRELERYISHGI